MSTDADGYGVAPAFREVMAGVATPVAVVTGLEDGLPHGTTVSAFSSLSMNPPDHPPVFLPAELHEEVVDELPADPEHGHGGQHEVAARVVRRGD